MTVADRYNRFVTMMELRHLLCGKAERFTLPTRTMKERIGSPADIRVLRNWCQKTGRDVVLMTFCADDGSVEVFCPIGFLNQEEAVLDGWIGAATSDAETGDDAPARDEHKGIDHLRELFDRPMIEATSSAATDVGATAAWRKVEQLSFTDLIDRDADNRGRSADGLA